jgi:hypothetical protein
LGRTVQETLECVTSTEFLEWQAFEAIESNQFHREDYFLAQIAAEVCRSRVKNPSRIKDSDFLIKFQTRKPRKLSEEDLKNRVESSKAKWLGAVMGTKPRKPPKPKKPKTQ